MTSFARICGKLRGMRINDRSFNGADDPRVARLAVTATQSTNHANSGDSPAPWQESAFRGLRCLGMTFRHVANSRLGAL
jgi:hypothetical protein